MATDDGGLTVGDLRCEYRDRPLGIGVERPRLSWALRSDRMGARQRAFRIRVASTVDGLLDDTGAVDLWDSGWVEAADPCHHAYGGPPLPGRARAHWTVAVEDDTGAGSPWAAPSWWETGLDPGDWRAVWIGRGDRRVPHLRRRFTVDGDVAEARLHVSTLGLHRAHLGGVRVGDDELAPGWTDYRARVPARTYDVTDLVRPGANVLALVIADGWYAGHLGWFGDHSLYGTHPLVLAQLDVRRADGTWDTVVATDGQWLAAQGPTMEADLFHGELHDARRDLGDWHTEAYEPEDHVWRAAIVPDPQPTVSVDPAVGDPVRAVDIRVPVAWTEPVPGVHVVDLGQNIGGWARIRVEAPRGTAVRLRFAEALHPDGTVFTDNLRLARATDTYVCAGTGIEEWEPSFTFHGFRYVEVTGCSREAIESLVGVVVHTALDRTGELRTGNRTVDRLVANIRWGLRGNLVEVPTDCPQRDERLGWMGDAQIIAPTACFHHDMGAFFTKWMVDVADGQSDDGTFPDVAPKVIDPQDGAPGWGDAGTIVPWTVWEWYGDRRMVSTYRPAVTRWVDWIASANPGGLWLERRAGDIGDWLSPPGVSTPKEVVATAFFFRSASIAAAMAEVDGDGAEAARLGGIADGVRSAFAAEFVGSDGLVLGDSQTAYALAVRFGLVPDELRDVVAQRFVERVEADGYRPMVGFLGVAHLLPALTSVGRNDVAYRLLFAEGFPSWRHQLDLGATTMWERWDGYTIDSGFTRPGEGSFNHYAFGAVGEWLHATVGGIAPDPSAPGFRRALVAPRPGGGIERSTCSYRSIRGSYAVDWSVAGGAPRLTVTVPPTGSALVDLDDPVWADVAPHAPDAVETGPRTWQIPPGTTTFTR